MRNDYIPLCNIRVSPERIVFFLQQDWANSFLVAFLIEGACSSRAVLFQGEGFMCAGSLFSIEGNKHNASALLAITAIQCFSETCIC